LGDLGGKDVDDDGGYVEPVIVAVRSDDCLGVVREDAILVLPKVSVDSG